MSIKKMVLPPLLLLILIAGIIILSKNPAQPSGETKITPADPIKFSNGFFIGILPTPEEGQTFEQAYLEASKFAQFSPVWGKPTPFYNLANELAGQWGQTFVEHYIRGNGMFPIIQMSFINQGLTLVTPPGLDDATMDDSRWREAYKQAVLDVVKVSRPLYLSIGNEVNRWYEKYGANENDPNGFQHYVSLYEEIYDAVKEISPTTKVFCTFAREMVNEGREADISILTMFNPDKMDLLAFTSYPYAVAGINEPSDIPQDYYSKLFNYIPNKPFGFSELGWPSIDAFGGERGQADFITKTSGPLTKEQGMNLQLFGWAWLHDLDKDDRLGLLKRDGTEKIAYSVWKNLLSQN
ncbi:MAG: hypothetical protein ACP5PX_03725 [Candidatus Hadarchaeum sp.]|uniref:hypothetical protein n=1 Tax=Candidatus Hadarchaeum sp. TaxID=2883567 RepID=UPI003D0AB2A3